MAGDLNWSSNGPRSCRLAAVLSLILLLPPLGVGACATAGGSAGTDGPAEAEAEAEAAEVEVTNRNWQDMHIYVLAAGQRWSLGVVTSMSESTFELPDGIFAAGRDVVFLADPVGSVVAYHSDPVLLEPGDRVEWTLLNRLRQSSLFIR